MGGVVFNVIAGSLSGRNQWVVVNGICREEFRVVSDIPQNSCCFYYTRVIFR